MGPVPYNQVLGIASSNVPAYSNGDDDYFSGQPNHLHGVFTGYRWQCVEFARRWLLIRKTAIFRNIGSASDIWHDLTHVERVTDGKKFPLIAHPNGSSERPKRGTLLIYARCRDLPFGHVAIITDVGSDFVRIAEQNYRFHRWTSDYARQISLVKQDGGYHIRDRYRISGWMEIADQGELQPLDQQAVDIIQSQRR